MVLKIDNTDFSYLVQKLTVKQNEKFTQKVNVLGNSLVDWTTEKYTLEITFRVMNEAEMEALLAVLRFNNTYTFINPANGEELSINGIIADKNIEYYSLATDVRYNKMKLKVQQL